MEVFLRICVVDPRCACAARVCWADNPSEAAFRPSSISSPFPRAFKVALRLLTQHRLKLQ